MDIPAIADLLDLTGRRVAVTGSSGGIGAGIARRFAAAGADVAVHGHRDLDGLERVAEAVRGHGRKTVAVRADLATINGAEKLVAQAVRGLGGLDVLVNNAGIYPVAGLLEMSAEDWDKTVAANLRSVFLCTQAAARQMIAQGAAIPGRDRGAIVNIASIEATRPAAGHSHYAAAKAGVLHHTRAAALELGPHGIRVNAVSPGLIDRPGLADDWPDGVERWRAAAPLERLGTPEDVADACLFLASPAARWITGIDLPVDGGALVTPSF